MIFIYLKDGRRVDLPDAVSVIHRSQVVFLDKDGEIVRQLATEEIYAYSHALYDENSIESFEEPPVMPRPFRVLDSGEAIIAPRRRHRRGVRGSASAVGEASSETEEHRNKTRNRVNRPDS